MTTGAPLPKRATEIFLWTLGCVILPGLPVVSGRAAETGWQLSLGAGMISAPAYPGSDKIAFFPFPFFEATYNDWFFASVIDGIGAGFQPVKNLTLSLALGVDLEERRARDDARFAGLKDVDYAPDARINARYEARGFFLDGTLHSRLSDATDRGTAADVDAGRLFLVQGPYYFSTGATCSLMDETYAKNFFGISAAQSAATGLRIFQARRGLEDAGGFIEVNQALGGRWELFARGQISQLQPRAANSPVVLRAVQPSLLLTVACRF